MNKIWFLAVFVCLYFSCTNEQQVTIDDQLLTNGVWEPIQLGPGENVITIKDYVLDVDEIDSILFNDKNIPIQNGTVTLTTQPRLKLGTLQFYVNGQELLLPVKATSKKKYTFEYTPQIEHESIKIKGEMNAWNPEDLVSGEGESYSKTFWMNPGDYQYKLILDGQEISDQSNPREVPNGIGGTNNVLTVEGPVQTEGIVPTIKNFDDQTVTLLRHPEVEYLALWNNYRIEPSIQDNNIEYSIPEIAKTYDRSYLRIWMYSEDLFSQSILLPLENGKIITDANQLTRFDHHTMILYNIFVDRFFNGNKENDFKNDSTLVHPRANYHGGDITGATQVLEDGYFDKLGVNTLWISPIVKNPKGVYGHYKTPETRFSAYHGYWPISFTLTDERLTTPKELKEFVNTAHENEKNVLLDFVANHVHEDHPFYQANPNVATNLYLPDGSLNTERWDDQRLTTWFDTFMPTLDLTRPEVYEMLADSAVFWLDEYNFDGFRHDATKHVPLVFWRELTGDMNAKRSNNKEPRLYQIGETYGTSELISSYLGNGMLDAQFDFNVYDKIVAGLAGDGSAQEVQEELVQSLLYYGDHHVMGNITGNQDRARFISYAAGDLSFSEDSKYAGWNRHIGISDSSAFQKSEMLNAFIATIPGLPVIFYGDEIGMPGGNDPDNRKMMRFDNLDPKEKNLLDQTSRLLHFRAESMPLQYGNILFYNTNPDVLQFERKYLDDQVFVVFNMSDQAHSIGVDPTYTFSFLNQKELSTSQVTMEPWTHEIFIKK